MNDYIQLVKFRYHLSFFIIVLGALFFAKQIDFNLFLSFLLVYISFNLFLYTGLYTINDIFDRKADALHPKKKNRAIAAGRISVFRASIFSVIVILLGLTIAFFAFKNLFYIYLIFIGLNLFYTIFGKKVPYLEIISNAITHPLRFVMGIVLVGATIPINLVIGYLLVTIGVSTERRIIELDYKLGHQSRKTSHYYKKKWLVLIERVSLLLIFVFFIMDFSKSLLLHLLLIVFYLVFILLSRHNKKFITFLQKIWLN
jgi:4-hydroxybenzoate polyprenyltransferase